MQRNAILVVLALLVIGVSGAGRSQRTSARAAAGLAQLRARTWLKVHEDPNAGDLGELKAENPEAYAIVNALLTKRSLGLLDPKHPRAAFAGSKVEENKPVGAAAFANLATPGELQGHAETPDAPQEEDQYADVPAQPVHHDWLSWKPQDSAMDDDAMVKNVLGQVTELAGSKNLRSKPANNSPLASEEASLSLGDDEAAQPQSSAASQPQAPSESPKLSTSQENSYWKSINVDNALTPTAESRPSENSYLKGIDLSSDEVPARRPEAAAVEVRSISSKDASDDLSNFSFDDEAAQAKSTTQAPLRTQAAARPSSLDAWLGMSRPLQTLAQKKTLVQKRTSAPAKMSNPYLVDLA